MKAALAEDYAKALNRLQQEKPASHQADDFLLKVTRSLNDQHQEFKPSLTSCCGKAFSKENYLVN